MCLSFNGQLLKAERRKQDDDVIKIFNSWYSRAATNRCRLNLDPAKASVVKSMGS